MDSVGAGMSTSSVPHQLVYWYNAIWWADKTISSVYNTSSGVLVQTASPYQESYHRSVIINNTQNEGVYTTQVQMSMSTVPMQQVWPERSQVHQTSSKQCKPTLSMAFTSNP